MALENRKKGVLLIDRSGGTIDRLRYIGVDGRKNNINYSNVVDIYKKISVSIPEHVLEDIPRYGEDSKKKNLTIRKKLAGRIIISKDNKIRYIDTEEFKRQEVDRFDLIEMLKQLATHA